MTELALDPDRSRILIHTYAEGLFARLAHDLELRCTRLEGRAKREGDDGGAKATASVDVPLDRIEVAGVLSRGGSVDSQAMSEGDKRGAIDKMLREVFHAAGTERVLAEGSVDGTSARIRIVTPRGRAVEKTVRLTLNPDGSAVRVTGDLMLSLAAIGSDPVKGPMNAFRVKDEVKVTFDLVFTPAT